MSAYKLEDLARISGVSPRTVRYYVQRGLLPAPAFHGSQTTYGAEHLARLKAIKKLQDERLALDEIEAMLAHKSISDLEALAKKRSNPPPAPKILPSSGPYRSGAPRSSSPTTWDRIVLADGVELHVRSDAPVDARRLALDIESQFGK